MIISRKVTPNMYRRYSELPLDNLVFISDSKPDFSRSNIFYYGDDVCIKNGFTGLHSKIRLTSWDKAFYHIHKTNNSYSNYYIIEDDVFLKKKV